MALNDEFLREVETLQTTKDRLFMVLEQNQRLERENMTLKLDMERKPRSNSPMVTPRNKREKIAAEQQTLQDLLLAEEKEKMETQEELRRASQQLVSVRSERISLQ